MTTPCGYYVDASDLTIVFKGYLYGTKQNDSGFSSTSYGKDISEIFQPVNGDPDSKINYDTDYKSNGLGGLDLKNYFMDINYPIVKITASGFDSNLSVFTGAGGGGTQTITDLTGMIVFTNISSASSLEVLNFPPSQYYTLNVFMVGGGGGGGGGGAAFSGIAYPAGAGGGGGGGYFNTGALSSGNTYTITIGSEGDGSLGAGGNNSYQETIGGIVYYYNVGYGANPGGNGTNTSCVSGSFSIVAEGGGGGGGGSGSGSSTYPPDNEIYGDGGGGGSGIGNGGNGDSGSVNGGGGGGNGNSGSTNTYSISLNGNTYNLYFGGGGGGGSQANHTLGNSPQYYDGGNYSGGQGGAGVNWGSQQQNRTGASATSSLPASGWGSGITLGGGGGGGSGAYYDQIPGSSDGYDGGSGSQGIAIVWWSVA